MATQSSFENPYDQLLFKSSSSSNSLHELRNGLSKRFQAQLEYFKQSKLNFLNSEMCTETVRDHTVYTGSAGLALYYFLCSLKHENSSEMLKESLKYLNINNLKGKKITFLCGDAGPLALATVISFKMGDQKQDHLPGYKSIAAKLLSLMSLLNESPDELLYGKAGYLYALLFVNKHTNGNDVIPSKHIEKVVTKILKSGKLMAANTNADCPLMWKWHDKTYLGAAHGIAGILYMLLQAHVYITATDLSNYIKPTLDWLMSQQFPSGNFPSSLESTSGDRLVQWCHGAPGFLPLCILASQVYSDEKYMNIALKLGDVIWERGLITKGYSLCHGVSGNAYAFLQLYQATKDPVQLYRASCFMEWCVVERPGTELRKPDRPNSLFEGIIGRLYLAQELNNPFDAKFPGLTIC